MSGAGLRVWRQGGELGDEQIRALFAPREPGTGGGSKVAVRFTLTAPGCGMGDILRQDIERKVLALPGVTEADVQLQLDPPWDQSRMSEAAKLQLGLI